MKLIKNFLYVIGYQVVILLVPILLSPYLSRVVGPSGIGTYSYTYSIVTLFSLFGNLGVSKYGNREIAKCGEDRHQRSLVFAEITAVKAVGAAVVLSVYGCFVVWRGGAYTEALVIQTLTLVSFLLDISWFFWGVQQFRLTTAMCAAVKFASVIFIFTLVRTEADVNRYIFILAAGSFLMQFAAWFFLPRYIDFVPFFRHIVNRHWKSMILLFFPVVAKYAYSSMDRIMLGNLVNITEVGYYENVQSIVNTFLTIQIALGDVVMPRMTLCYEMEDTGQRDKLFRFAFHITVFLAVGTMFGLIGVSEAFIPMFYGEKFIYCIALLQLVAPTVLFAGLSDLIRTAVLLPQYRDKEYIVALVSGAVLNFIINYTLIPRLLSVGAVIGTVCAELLVLIIQLWYVRGEIKIRSFLGKAVIYCVMGSAILAPCAVVGGLSLSRPATVVLDILLGGVLYGGLVLRYL